MSTEAIYEIVKEQRKMAVDLALETLLEWAEERSFLAPTRRKLAGRYPYIESSEIDVVALEDLRAKILEMKR